ncbi:MAG: deoxyribodipyrimidine photo-lyase [Bdellovibrionales bacterium]
MKAIFWFRRDLRLFDNAGLFHALNDYSAVLPVFIFDTHILSRVSDPQDRRVQFIHQTLAQMKQDLQKVGSDILVLHGKPEEVLPELLQRHSIQAIYTNHDYEPYARSRDSKLAKLAQERGVQFKTFKDQCLFEKSEILTQGETPYTVFTPYRRKWLEQLNTANLKEFDLTPLQKHFVQLKSSPMPILQSLNFQESIFTYPGKEVEKKLLQDYEAKRDFPFLEKGTSRLGIHLRFGTISIRQTTKIAQKESEAWLSELIWREFFMQILWHYPHVIKGSFRPQYDKIKWRDNTADFERWCEGLTGYPLVDAGMRELNQTGYMHNRVRMVVASFLSKHLLIHWLKGERYFAQKLLDYDLAANNGNWQWAAGSGCDAAPYFRVFNPEAQAKKFDPKGEYIRRWVPEWGTSQYPEPIVDHKTARVRALRAYEAAVK